MGTFLCRAYYMPIYISALNHSINPLFIILLANPPEKMEKAIANGNNYNIVMAYYYVDLLFKKYIMLRFVFKKEKEYHNLRMKVHLGSTMSVTDSLGHTVQQVEYTPWGEVFVEQRSGNSNFSTPYLFNGKELDEESGLYYYGARYYDPKLSLWYSTDPMQMDYPWVSTYGYCLGNPILYNDINGNYPIILITKIKSWKTAKQRIIGYSGNRIARVPLYFAIVIDTEDENYISVFYVTRDALTVREKDHHGNILGVSNVGFEPKDDKHNRYRAKVMKYPNGSNSLALKLMQDGSETIHAESNEVSVEMNYRKKADVAEGIMLHVGGFYLRYGKPEIAASEGCFGITDGSNAHVGACSVS